MQITTRSGRDYIIDTLECRAYLGKHLHRIFIDKQVSLPLLLFVFALLL